MDLRRYVRTNGLLALGCGAACAPPAAGARGAGERGGRALLVSAENISVHPIDFWRGTDPTPEQVARRLAALAGGAGALAPVRVVIGLRRQDQWLASRYAGVRQGPARLSPGDFDRRLTEIAAVARAARRLGWLDHHHIYARFAAVLGAENVHLYWLERLAAKPIRTLARIGRFIGGEALGRQPPRIGRRGRAAAQRALGRRERLAPEQRPSELRLTPELAGGGRGPVPRQQQRARGGARTAAGGRRPPGADPAHRAAENRNHAAAAPDLGARPRVTFVHRARGGEAAAAAADFRLYARVDRAAGGSSTGIVCATVLNAIRTPVGPPGAADRGEHLGQPRALLAGRVAPTPAGLARRLAALARRP